MVGALLCLAVVDAGAQTSGDTAIVQISAVLASREHREFDPRLKPIRQDLRSLPFRGFSLISRRACNLGEGDRCAMQLAGDGYLQITTTETTPSYLKLRMLLNRRNRPVVNADLKLNRNAGIILTSSRVEGGTLVLSIRVTDAAAGSMAAEE